MHINEPLNPPSEAKASFEAAKRMGVLLKTLALPPTIQKVVPARVRSKNKDDFFFIGKDFIHLNEIDHEGNVTHIATKDDFDCSILSANTIGHFDAVKNELDDYEDDIDARSMCSDGPKMAPQMLALVLDTSQLVFLTVHESEDGLTSLDINYHASSIELPTYTPEARRLGKHLAVDPQSRAIAVAAGEDNLFFCSAKEAEKLETGQRWDVGFLPVSSSRNFHLPQHLPQSTILLMDFLPPPKETPDQVLLLLIVLQDRDVRPVLIEWSHDGDVQSATFKIHQRILSRKCPILLVQILAKHIRW